MSHFKLTLVMLLGNFIIGCATLPGPPEEHDPFEGFNRSMYSFNAAADEYVLAPLARGYQAITPQPVDKGISNFFNNLDDVMVIFNDLLQLKFNQAGQDLSRVVWNSTVGIFGIFDVATPLGLPKHNEDFGQTLGYWGVSSGPYLVLPLFGPSTVRDGIGTGVEITYDPINEYDYPSSEARWSSLIIRVVDKRADLLQAGRIIKKAALDEYVFLREAYLQRRRNQVYDGNPPVDELDLFNPEDLFQDPPPADDADGSTTP